MSRKLKELMVKEMADRFGGLSESGCVVVGLNGLSGRQAARVRASLSENGARMMVVRNRLFKIAMDEAGVSSLAQLLDGPSAIVTGADVVQAAKAAEVALQGSDALSVLGGYADGRVLDATGVKKLASLPVREVLLGQVLSCMCAPAQGFLGCLQGAARQLASVLHQIKENKQQEAQGQ